MTIKRPRFVRSSSSFGSLPEDRTWNAPASAAAAENRLMERESVTKSLKQSVMSDEDSGSLIGIRAVSSPPVAAVKQRKGSDCGDRGGGGGAGVEAFYEKCAWCEKKIGHGDDVFMYSYLRAFCSADCRSEQIRMDTKMEIASHMKKETKPGPSSKNNAVKLFGVGIAEGHSDPHSHVN